MSVWAAISWRRNKRWGINISSRPRHILASAKAKSTHRSWRKGNLWKCHTRILWSFCSYLKLRKSYGQAWRQYVCGWNKANRKGWRWGSPGGEARPIWRRLHRSMHRKLSVIAGTNVRKRNVHDQGVSETTSPIIWIKRSWSTSKL